MNSFKAFQPFVTAKASDVVYEQIRDRILDGTLKPGTKLPSENELSNTFKRSRPTVREALRMLESNQYITTLRGSGATVNAPSTYEIQRCIEDLIKMRRVDREEIAYLRRICEPMMAGWAAQRRTEKDLEELEEILATAQGLISKPSVYVQYSVSFHKVMARAAKNPVASLVNDITHTFWVNMHNRYFETCLAEGETLCRRYQEQHFKILKAIANRDDQEARRLVSEHLEFSTWSYDAPTLPESAPPDSPVPRMEHVRKPIGKQRKSDPAQQKKRSQNTSELMEAVFEEFYGRGDVDALKLSQFERMRLIERLQELKGFQNKGAVKEVAARLNVSAPTVYRYLNELSKLTTL